MMHPDERTDLKITIAILALLWIALMVAVATSGCRSASNTESTCVPVTEVHEVPVEKLVNPCKDIKVDPLPTPPILSLNATVEEKIERLGNWIEKLEEYSKKLHSELEACSNGK